MPSGIVDVFAVMGALSAIFAALPALVAPAVFLPRIIFVRDETTAA